MAGQPTLYRDDYVEQLIEFFDVDPYTIGEDGPEATDMRTLAGFARKIKVHRDTMHEWTKAKDSEGNLKHPEWAYAYRLIKDIQENFLLVNGNKGLINPAFGIFSLKNICGFRDKQPDEVDVVVNNVTERKDEDIDKRYAELMAKAEAEKCGPGLPDTPEALDPVVIEGEDAP